MKQKSIKLENSYIIKVGQIYKAGELYFMLTSEYLDKNSLASMLASGGFSDNSSVPCWMADVSFDILDKEKYQKLQEDEELEEVKVKITEISKTPFIFAF